MVAAIRSIDIEAEAERLRVRLPAIRTEWCELKIEFVELLVYGRCTFRPDVLRIVAALYLQSSDHSSLHNVVERGCIGWPKRSSDCDTNDTSIRAPRRDATAL